MTTLQVAMWLGCLAVQSEPTTSIHFDTDIIPVLTKAGCNSGSCHGAAAGRGGFHLSLFGSDPASDYEAIAHAFEGRRVNLAHPEKSLIIKKPTGITEHGGDVIWETDSSSAELLLNWIRTGTQRDKTPKLTQFSIHYNQKLDTANSRRTKLMALARFDDRTHKDVTPWVVFTPLDPTALALNDTHEVTALRPGQHTIIARFLDQVVPVEFLVPFDHANLSFYLDRQNLIDEYILQKLQELQLPVSPPADDAAWFRRVHLDLVGRLPEPADLDLFSSDRNPCKRVKLIDRLLASDACLDYWTWKFARLLNMHSLPHEQQALVCYHTWLRDQLSSPVGWDTMASQLILSTGDSHHVGPANFARMTNNSRSQIEHIGQCFAGIRLECANCHNHPFDRWTQDDYHGFAAMFAGIERGRELRFVLTNSVTHPRTGQPATPRVPGGESLDNLSDHRKETVKWLLSDDNPLLATAMVNRLWQAMFGRGLVESPNDLRQTNPATHPELLQELTREFIAHDYDFRHTLRSIAISDTYARSTQTIAGNEHDDKFYSHRRPKTLSPEVLLDAICDVTGVPHTNARQLHSRAIQIVDAAVPDESLERLGRCNRLNGCDNESNSELTLGGELHLINGELINGKLKSEEGRLRRLVSNKTPVDAILREFLKRGLVRNPLDAELEEWQKQIASDDPTEQRHRLEDFVWSLLHSHAFRENR